eukprot:gene4991-biopygen5590
MGRKAYAAAYHTKSLASPFSPKQRPVLSGQRGGGLATSGPDCLGHAGGDSRQSWVPTAPGAAAADECVWGGEGHARCHVSFLRVCPSVSARAATPALGARAAGPSGCSFTQAEKLRRCGEQEWMSPGWSPGGDQRCPEHTSPPADLEGGRNCNVVASAWLWPSLWPSL